MPIARLSPATLPERWPDHVQGPAVDPRATTVGIVHLGVGAFHRSHQAVFTEDSAAAAEESGWGVLGVSPRSGRVVDQLMPQKGLYGVLTKGNRDTSLRIIGSLRGAAVLREETERVLAAIAASTTHVVSLTVSEKGYRRTAAGALDLRDGDVRADVDALAAEPGRPGATGPSPAATPVGALARGLARRHREHGAPITILCCDNMIDNGQVVYRLVRELLTAAASLGRPVGGLTEWVERSVRWPATMVDRITPATTEEHRSEAGALLGLRDEALVVAEPFAQWVIEDDFAAPRPPWELAGAIVTKDVAPYERVKLRMLNGSHSAIAYLGALLGYETIHEALADPAVADLTRALMDDDVAPTLTPPEGVDLATYRDQVLERFANPSIRYTTLQVATDGSQKVPVRLLGTVQDCLSAGAVPQSATRAVAAWVVFVARGQDRYGRALRVDDPIADQLRAATRGADRTLVDRMLTLDVIPQMVRDHPGFRAALTSDVKDLLRLVPAG